MVCTRRNPALELAAMEIKTEVERRSYNMTDTERCLISNLALNIMSGTLDEQEIYDDAKQMYELSKRPDWTPCANGMPNADAKDTNGNDIAYLCTIQSPFRNCDIIREYCYGTHIGFDGKDCIGWFFSGDYRGSIYSDISVVAWMPKPDPYNPDHIVENSHKV